MMKRCLVLGIGNRLMMDDGIGIYMVEALQEQYSEEIRRGDQVTKLVIGESDLDYCVEQVLQVALFIIVDAAQLGKKPGEITLLPFHQLSSLSLHHSAHDLHLFHLLQVMEQVEQQKITGYLLGIEPYEIRFHWGLSDLLQDQFPMMLEEMKTTLATLGILD
ncbi:hydrogenase maturation protease [Rubeoparvulum massiliense]|uniref:hydrogenase maturation protease n=1 Tax=Rubeoparvulum massiliense TaxID=1631346 RepID=UPI00065E3E92|nr:hydrogenase maturation protease [Rubeoparvulum massiliense]